jgi:hypothetical protein
MALQGRAFRIRWPYVYSSCTAELLRHTLAQRACEVRQRPSWIFEIYRLSASIQASGTTRHGCRSAIIALVRDCTREHVRVSYLSHRGRRRCSRACSAARCQS